MSIFSDSSSLEEVSTPHSYIKASKVPEGGYYVYLLSDKVIVDSNAMHLLKKKMAFDEIKEGKPLFLVL